jgi:hypothetical protein
MERLQRLLRLARLRGDRVAIATLETRIYWTGLRSTLTQYVSDPWRDYSESELRMMWGDR